MTKNDYYCQGCGESCNLKVVDEGIGGYEYWGAHGVHQDFVVYSDCCEDIVTDSYGEEYGQNVLMRQVEEDNFDPPEDW